MRVLVACEFSQVVTSAFLRYGCDAYSCDLEPTIGDFPNRHIQGDVRDILYDDWDIVIAHPPCTYMANSGFLNVYGDLDRNIKVFESVEFFKLFWNLPGRVCIENPKPSPLCGLPEHSIIVQPYDFGDDYSKLTYLWLKNLPPFMNFFTNGRPIYSLTYKYRDAKRRSIFSPGIAEAMAAAWHDLPLLETKSIHSEV